MTLSLEHFLTVAMILFSVGLIISLSKRNAIGILMGVELMLNAVNLALITFARFGESEMSISGHAFVAFVITVAAAEAAVALALVISVYRTHGTIEVDQLSLLRF